MKSHNLPLLTPLLASLLALHPGHAQVEEIIETFHDASDPRILIMAHRGGYLEEPVLPENSIPAIERALAAGMDIIETDFYLTSDGHMVAMHDWSLDRTTTAPARSRITPWRRFSNCGCACPTAR